MAADCRMAFFSSSAASARSSNMSPIPSCLTISCLPLVAPSPGLAAAFSGVAAPPFLGPSPSSRTSPPPGPGSSLFLSAIFAFMIASRRLRASSSFLSRASSSVERSLWSSSSSSTSCRQDFLSAPAFAEPRAVGLSSRAAFLGGLSSPLGRRALGGSSLREASPWSWRLLRSSGAFAPSSRLRSFSFLSFPPSLLGSLLSAFSLLSLGGAAAGDARFRLSRRLSRDSEDSRGSRRRPLPSVPLYP
mmetsp:Transcript_29276/g.77826  ORF Transcript_29276/g.77826 Transcript_29276/m.77826 type:complete len:246 (-) Transcript_29276:34-771(-)